MTDLTELTQQMEAEQKTSQVLLEEVPWNTRPAWDSAIKLAKEELKRLTEDHRKKVIENVLAIFVDGNSEYVNNFVSKAQSTTETFVLDGLELYRKLADPVWASLGPSKEFGPTQVSLVGSYLTGIMTDLEVRELKQPDFTEMVVLNSYQETLDYIVRTFRAANGDDFNALYLTKKLSQQVYDARFTKTVVPAVFTGVSTEAATALGASLVKEGAKPSRVENSLSLTYDPDDATVLKLLEQVKKKLKK